MKDILIAIVILAVLTVLFSVYGTPPEQDTAPKAETQGEGTQEQGESSHVLPGNEDLQHAESPKTGDWLLEIFG